MTEIIFFGLSIFEVLIVSTFLVLFGISTFFERRHNTASSNSYKWTVFVVGLLAFAYFSWSHRSEWTFYGLIEMAWTWDFWKPVVVYISLGLLYCIPEFMITVKRFARTVSEEWDQLLCDKVIVLSVNGEYIEREECFVNGTRQLVSASTSEPVVEESISVNELIKRAKSNDSVVLQKLLKNTISTKVNQLNTFRNRTFLNFKYTDDQVETVIDHSDLATYVGAWIMFWPGYLISLVLGGIMEELAQLVASVFGKIGGRFVRMMFSNVFKV